MQDFDKFEKHKSFEDIMGGGLLGEGNFDQKNNSLFGQVKLFLPVLDKNLMTDRDDIIANKK
jgi:hypothetical protein